MKKLLLLLALTLSITACTGARQPAPELHDMSAPFINVVYSTDDFYDSLLVYNMHMGSTGKMNRCVVTLKNLTEYSLPVEYNFEWQDSMGVPQLSSSAWNRITLSPNQQKTIASVSKTPDGQQVTLNVRDPENILLKPEFARGKKK